MEYFPFDLAMPSDPRVEALKLAGGMSWAGMWYETLGMLWQTDMTISMLPVLARRFDVEMGEVQSFLDTCARVGLIDAEAWASGRITNNGIARRKAAAEARTRSAKAAGKASARARSGRAEGVEKGPTSR